MESNKKEKIIGKMQELADAVDARLDTKKQTREDITYYDDFEFKGSNLAVRSVYIVEISNENNEKTADKSEEKYTTYEIYDKNGKKIADVDEKGKIYFDKEFTEKLKQIDSKYLEQLNIDDIEFELPEKLSEKDVHLTREELSEEKERNIGSRREKNEDKKDKNQKEEKEEENQEKETEEEKKQKTAEALGIDETEIKSISTIDLNQKVTDKPGGRKMDRELLEKYADFVVKVGVNVQPRQTFLPSRRWKALTGSGRRCSIPCSDSTTLLTASGRTGRARRSGR